MLKKDWELHHICLIVRDWNKTVEYYQSTRMGISVGPQVMGLDYRDGGPVDFNINDKIPRANGGLGPGKPLKEVSKRGRRDNHYKFLDKDCLVGDLIIEIGEDMGIPLEGITHICFNVPDPKAETKKLLEKGFVEKLSFTQGDVLLENHIYTSKYGNIDISFRPPLLKYERAWIDHHSSYPFLKEWKFHGIGIGVKDLDKTVEYYEMLDIIDFQHETKLDSNLLDPIKISNETSQPNFKTRVRSGQVGPMAFEFYQPLEGTTVYQESMDSRGEGVADIAFTVTDLGKETEAMIYRGMPIVLSGKPKNGPAFAYFDSREYSGNILVRLIQRE